MLYKQELRNPIIAPQAARQRLHLHNRRSTCFGVLAIVSWSRWLPLRTKNWALRGLHWLAASFVGTSVVVF
jgi:hypothetical protein